MLLKSTPKRSLALAAAGIIAAFSAVQSVLAETAGTGTVTVFAAASLKNALDAASAAYAKSTGRTVVASYAASPALAKQIEQAAPADLFISADQEWMDYLAGKNLIDNGTRANLVGNHLVLVAPVDSKVVLSIAKGFDLSHALGGGKLAMADVNAVPAGKYGKASLEYLGVWAAVEAQVAQAENVRAALALVARGEAAMGIVYQSDALAEPKVKVIGMFPDESHPPIVYPAAVTAAAKNAAAAGDFVTYLKSTEAQAIFAKEGFVVLK